MTIETLPFEHRPRNSIANNLDKINELIDWANLDTHLYASASGESVTVDDASSLKGLTVDGRSVQDGTPTPDAPVPVQVVEGVNLIDSENPTHLYIGSGDNTLKLLAQVTSYIAKVIRNTVYTVSFKSANRLIISGTGSVIPADGVPATIIFDKGSAPSTTTFNSGENDYLVIHLATNSNVIDPQLEKGYVATPYIPFESIGVVVGDTMVPIDLQGNILASLPDGTHDELHVDSAGHVTVEKNVGEYVFDGTQSVGGTTGTAAYYTISTIIDIVSPPQLAPSSSSPHAGGYSGWCDKYAINDNYVTSDPIDNTVVISSRRFSSTNRIAFYDSMHTSDNATWIAYVSANPITLYYPYSEPQYIDLGYITPPAITSGSVVTISASLTPEFTLDWWVDNGITTLVNDLIAYVDHKTEV